MTIAICNGTEVAYLLSDSADLSQWPLVIDGSDRFTVGFPFAYAKVTGVSVDPTIPVQFLLNQAGTIVVSQPAYNLYLAQKAADRQAALAPVSAIIASSFAATLRRQADALNKQGQSYEAVQLLLQAQRISP